MEQQYTLAPEPPYYRSEGYNTNDLHQVKDNTLDPTHLKDKRKLLIQPLHSGTCRFHALPNRGSRQSFGEDNSSGVPHLTTRLMCASTQVSGLFLSRDDCTSKEASVKHAQRLIQTVRVWYHPWTGTTKCKHERQRASEN